MTFSEKHAEETYKSLISISVEGLKALLLINGGAVVALLAYLGQAKDRQGLAIELKSSLSLFVLGAAAATAAFFASYFTQLELYDLSTHGTEGAENRHKRYFWITAVLSVLSLAAFSFGAFAALTAFTTGPGG